MKRDFLTRESLTSLLPDNLRDLQIFVYDITDSTNTRAEDFARSGGGEAVFIAREQTAGRGRLGRSFFSGRDSGIYISFLLGESASAESALALTTYSAVILSRVIEQATNLAPKIKWVNDIYLSDRKCAGILASGQVSADGGLDWAVVGIGLNVFGSDFPEDIKDIATSLERERAQNLSLNRLTASLITEFYSNLALLGSEKIAEEYRSRQMLIGRRVTVSRGNDSFTATVIGISDDSALLIRRDGGEQEALTSGEVSVHL